jgi:hypothetical protein
MAGLSAEPTPHLVDVRRSDSSAPPLRLDEVAVALVRGIQVGLTRMRSPRIGNDIEPRAREDLRDELLKYATPQVRVGCLIELSELAFERVIVAHITRLPR